MNIFDTYLMVQQLSAVNRLSGLQSPYNNSANTASGLSFRNILQNVQANDSNSTKTISAGSTMDELFERAAEKYHVDVNLLKAIGKAESNFNAAAVSPAGAVGVMQLMPQTARYLGVSNPYDAQQNIMGGAKYISELLDRYNGNTKLALAAYNAGPGNVAKYGGIPPFTETQNYVNRVLNYAGQTLTAGGAVTAETAESAPTQETAAGTINIKTETLLELLNLMRMQSQLRLGSMMTSPDENRGIFSL